MGSFGCPGQQSQNLDIGQRNFAQQFSFAEQENFTPDLNSPKRCFGVNPLIFNPPTFNPPDFYHLVTTLNRKIPSASETLGLWRLCQSARSLLNTRKSKFLYEEDISKPRYDSDFTERSGLSWTAILCYIGLEDKTPCKTLVR